MTEHGMALAAIVIALVTLILGVVSSKNAAGRDYVGSVEERVKSLDTRVRDCEQDRNRLRDENRYLVQRLMVLEQHAGIEPASLGSPGAPRG